MNPPVRILLVEDDETSREMLQLRLELKGFEVMVAADGGQALAMARAEAPGLILMDMNIPVMDGWTVTRALKDDPATAAVPIIGVSAHAMAGDREKAAASGCDDYETKPVEWLSLLPKIRDLLARRAAAAAAGTGPA